MEWPKAGEKLFRSEAEYWHFNACINCYYPTLGQLAHHYKEGANTLARATAQGDATLDCVILPIVYLYRQYLELAIKDIIDTARRLEGEGHGYPMHHNLRDLWAEATRIVRKHYGQDVPPEMDYVQPCIDEFNSHDPESFAFRYPTDKKGNANLRGIQHISLRNLYETMGRLSSFLDCISSDLGQKYDWMCEMRSQQ